MDITADALVRLNDNPLYRVLGIHLHEALAGSARATLIPNPQVCWPSPPQPHGGILFTVMDTTMAFAVMSVAEPDRGCATVDCSIQYPAPARDGPFVCTAVAAKNSGRTVFVRGEITDAHGLVVAFGQATFRIVAAKT